MSHSTTVHVPAEFHLDVTATDFADVRIERPNFVPSVIQVVEAGLTVSIGPFSDARQYRLTSNDHEFTYSVQPDKLGYNHQGTGIFDGGILSINGTDNTQFDIAAGSGVVVDNTTDPSNPIISVVVWDAFVGIDAEFIADVVIGYVAIDKKGEIQQFNSQLTSEQRREFIQLGLIGHVDNLTIVVANTKPMPGYDQAHMLIDMADSIGTINRNGNVFSANGANLKVDKSPGQSFAFGSNWVNSQATPNITENPELTAPVMFDHVQDGSGGFNAPNILTEVDPSQWDDGSGTLALVPASDPWQIQRIIYSPETDLVVAAYGQELHKSLAGAEAAIFGEEFNANPTLSEGSLRGFLLLRRSATDLTDPLFAKFIEADRFGGGPQGGVSTSTTTLQQAYDNSPTPEIVTTAAGGPVCVKEGTGTSTNKCFMLLDNDDNEVFSIDGRGRVKIELQADITASRPASPRDYQMFFDTTLGIPIWYDGTNWVDATGATV